MTQLLLDERETTTSYSLTYEVGAPTGICDADLCVLLNQNADFTMLIGFAALTAAKQFKVNGGSAVGATMMSEFFHEYGEGKYGPPRRCYRLRITVNCVGTMFICVVNAKTSARHVYPVTGVFPHAEIYISDLHPYRLVLSLKQPAPMFLPDVWSLK
jgi:hypothetical protein